jgi:CO dehydrogenase maturation factor
MKVAFSGKGGVGKTTVAAALCLRLAARGVPVLAVDADTNPNLAAALGFEEDAAPISAMRDLIRERTGADPARPGLFKLNPRVDDIPGRFALRRGPLTLVVMGAVERGGKGCACAENAFLRDLLSHLLLREGEWVVADMEAGVEHLGRATARAVDVMAVVSEPTPRAALTAQRVAKLSADIGVRRIGVVGNKVRGPDDVAFLEARLAPLPLVGWLPLLDRVADLERSGRQELSEAVPAAEVEKILAGLEGLTEARQPEGGK